MGSREYAFLNKYERIVFGNFIRLKQKVPPHSAERLWGGRKNAAFSVKAATAWFDSNGGDAFSLASHHRDSTPERRNGIRRQRSNCFLISPKYWKDI